MRNQSVDQCWKMIDDKHWLMLKNYQCEKLDAENDWCQRLKIDNWIPQYVGSINSRHQICTHKLCHRLQCRWWAIRNMQLSTLKVCKYVLEVEHVCRPTVCVISYISYNQWNKELRVHTTQSCWSNGKYVCSTCLFKWTLIPTMHYSYRSYS